MKKILILLLFLPFNILCQCIPIPECGISNTTGNSPRSCGSWIKQTFFLSSPGTLQELRFYVGISGNTSSEMKVEILENNTNTILFTDTLPLPAVGTYFLYCDTTNWSTIHPEIFLSENEEYSFRIEKIDPGNTTWIIYSTNNDLFTEGSCTNDLNELDDFPDASDPDSYDQMGENEDCTFTLKMQCPCLGDYNFDGTRSVLDLIMLINAFGETSAAIDITGDALELVSVDDLMMFIGLYGVPCP